MKSISDKIIIYFFITLLLIPLLAFNGEKNKISENEKRYLANPPILFDESGKISATFGDDYDKWFKDNLGFRKAFITLCAEVEYNLFNRCYSNDVVSGSDGWLYLNDDNNIEIVKGEYPNLGETELKKICDNQIKVQNYLKKQGIEYVLILTPSKISIYPEYIYEGYYTPEKTPVDILADYLEEHSDIKVVRVKDALLKMKMQDNNLLYLKTDTHWSWYGIKTGYTEIFRKLSEWGILTSPIADGEVYVKGETLGDLAWYNFITKPEIEYGLIIKNRKGAKIYEEGNRETYINEYAEEKKILIYGDSMANGLGDFLEESVSDITVLYAQLIDQHTVNLEKPDIIIYRRGERYISELVNEQKLLYRMCILNEQENSANFYYYDAGEYDSFHLAIWPKECFEEKVILEGVRTDSDTWLMTLDLNQFDLYDDFVGHFYGVEANKTQHMVLEEEYNFVS